MYTKKTTKPKVIHEFHGSLPTGFLLSGNDYHPPMGPAEYTWAQKYIPDMQKEYAHERDVKKIVNEFEERYGQELPQGKIPVKRVIAWKKALEMNEINASLCMYLLTSHTWREIPNFGNGYYGGEQIAYVDVNIYNAPPIDSVLRYIIDKFEKEYFGEENLKILDWKPDPKYRAIKKATFPSVN